MGGVLSVFVTRILPDAAMDRICAAATTHVWPAAGPPSGKELLAHCRDADGLLCLLTDRVDGDLLDACPRLRVVSNMAVGVDNIDLDACRERGVAVGNTPGVLTETTADLAFALLLAGARRLSEAERFLRDGRWKTWSPMLLTGQDAYAATLGLVGLGRIGAAMARRARGFDMRILYTGPRRHPETEAETGAQFRDLDSLLQDSDFVSLHCPLSDDTRGLIGASQLARMKRTALLINTARGPVVDQAALAVALRAGTIGGAALDVFENEPLATNDPLLACPNLTVAPHIGSASVKTRTKMAMMAAENLIAGLEGRPLPTAVVQPEPGVARRLPP